MVAFDRFVGNGLGPRRDRRAVVPHRADLASIERAIVCAGGKEQGKDQEGS
jgi:hypothetical protein